VTGIAGWGGKIQPVQEQELESVRILLKSRCPSLRGPSRPPARTGAAYGRREGVEGILVRTKGKARLVISISVLSQSVAAEVDAQDVEPIKRPISA
jgi:hypothetical protein